MATVLAVLLSMDGAIYNLICYVFEIFYYLCGLQLFNDSDYNSIDIELEKALLNDDAQEVLEEKLMDNDDIISDTQNIIDEADDFDEEIDIEEEINEEDAE